MTTIHDLPAAVPATDGASLSVVYTSTATVPFSEIDLALLLAVSRANNAPRGITGLLLFSDGHFMQALEGPERAVRRTLDTIAADPRHRDVRTVDESVITARRFGDWAMGYRAGEGRGGGSSWFGSPDTASPDDGSRAAALLRSFGGH